MSPACRCVVRVALVLSALLAPTAAATLVPDPTWIAGVYDGADADEILLLIWDGTPAVVPAPPVLLEPRATVLEPPDAVARLTASPPPAAASRAPPLR